ncbi:MAG: YgjP-like metallopeptidase domain-containing protein [Candidatus Sulfotelmatobacter sp.]
MPTQVKLGDLSLNVILKDIKNVHLSVHPPTGRVTVSAPLRMSLDTIRVFAISKLGWIKQQQRKFQEQERETPREYLDRESHYVWGRRYLLKVVEESASPNISFKHNKMILHTTHQPGFSL